MHISLILDPERLWAWHAVLIDELSRVEGRSVSVDFSKPGQPLPAAVRLGLAMERQLTAYNVHTAMAAIKPDAFTTWRGSPNLQADVVIDLAAARPKAKGSAVVLTPVYDGRTGEMALWAALMQGRSPRLQLHVSSRHALLDIGQPKTERPLALSRSAAEVITRLMSGIVRAVGDLAPARGLAAGAGTLLDDRLPNLTLALADKATRFVRRGLLNRVLTEPQWMVAWRRCQGDIGHPAAQIDDLRGYHTLQDDGKRYYADPFLFSNGDGIHMFVEEFPYARGRGLVSVCSLHADGTTDTPRPVLETDHHLSYPQIFARDGEIWMLPEASGSGKLTLYRAARYPDRWEPAADLIDRPVHDATWFEHAGRCWITAATQGSRAAPWGSSWDSLSLYSAPTLLGPWTAHRTDPVLIDAKTARPAGSLYTIADRLFRPVQDCSSYYGSALGIAEVVRLDDEAFEQKTVREVAFPKHTRLLGPHTLSRLATPGGFFEAIDVFGRLSDLRAAGAAL